MGKRTWIVDCKICHRWSSVPTLNMQAICREAGACLDCMKDEYFMLKVRIAAIEMVIENIAKRGKRLTEDERPALREVYVRKSRQLTAVREQLARLEANREQHSQLARSFT